MARISSYPIDATPTLSDKVVGSDVNDFNATKNYAIGDILSLASFNTLTSTKLWYGDGSNAPAETTAMTYVPGGLGSVPNDTITFNGATLFGDFTDINDDTSIVLGKGAVTFGLGGNEALYIGVEAGGNALSSWFKNTVIGYQAQYHQFNARESVAIGHQAMFGGVAWNGKVSWYNTAIGSSALRSLSDTVAGTDNNSGNTALGAYALTNLKNQSNNVGVGYNAGFSLASFCQSNTVIGANTLNDESIEEQFNFNTIVGSNIGSNTINGNAIGVSYNTALGHSSFTVLPGQAAGTFQGASRNTFIGHQAGHRLRPYSVLNNWSVDRNVGIGNAAYYQSGGFDNIAIGGNALDNAYGDRNIAIGKESGGEYNVGDNDNIAIGTRADWNSALIGITVKQQNIAIGNKSRELTSGGIHNIAIGFESQQRNNGEGNITVGGLSMTDTAASFTGSFNVAMGYGALSKTGNGEYNTAVGNDAGFDIVGGVNNTAVGKGAGNGLTTASNTTCLGKDAKALGNDEVVLGDGFVTTLRCNTPVISALSDQRDKTNIQPLGLGVDFLMDLNPVSWDWDRRDESMKGYKDVGFVAQELDSVRSEYSVEDILHKLVDKTNADQYWAAPSVLIPVLVKAIQELKAEINELKNGTN